MRSMTSLGAFHFLRNDLRIAQHIKDEVVQKCKDDNFKKFGSFNIHKVETLDGFKYWLSENEWVMIRPSGTEPVLRIYVEAADKKAAEEILEATLKEIGCAEDA